jgi:hypothetical protein
MKLFFQNKLYILAGILGLATSCEKEFFPQPPSAKVAKETTKLEASFTATPPLSLSDAYWKTADYLNIPLTDLSKNELYSDGFLNMTGTFKGLSSFNKGEDPKVMMKAAYDKTRVYIYIEWTDSDFSPEFAASIFNGPNDPLKPDTFRRWTSQGNSDKVALAFDIANASSATGTFDVVGCAASCHQNKMQTATGSVDIWNWDLALSDPLGFARDMMTDGTKGLHDDEGDNLASQNKIIQGNSRSAPIFEWDGTQQSYKRPDGKITLLDPGFYLLNKTPYIGDLDKGDKIYHDADYGCNHCHGEFGGGVGTIGEATAFASTGFAGKYSRASIKSYSASELHPGLSYWQKVPAANQDDLIAYIKGLGSIPGYYLKDPTGSSANIWSVSNVVRGRINTGSVHTNYKVILVRDLTTGNADDVQFLSPKGKSFPFGVALMDHDGKNHIGSLKHLLTFKL